MPDVVLLSKQDPFSEMAGRVARTAFGDAVLWLPGRRGDPVPPELGAHTFRVVLSFLSPWIVPGKVLRGAQVALNWHPASREYPGTGCYNFALYEGALEYGAVCHWMAEVPDTGEIVEERRFPVWPQDSVETLKLRTMIVMLAMFQDMVCKLVVGAAPPPSKGSAWSRKPFKRRDLEQLNVIDPTMSDEEVRRRVRAMTYPGHPGPHVVVAGERFVVPVPDRKPLA